MKTQEFKRLLGHISIKGSKLPPDEVLSSITLSAMLYICDKCVPNKLLRRVNDSGLRVYRNISDGFFILYPDTPNFNNTNEHIMIDEPLNWALIYEVAFRLNPDMPHFRQMSSESINDYIANYAMEIYEKPDR